MVKTLNRVSRAEPLFGLVEVDWRVPLRPVGEILVDARKVRAHAKIARFGPSMGIWVRQATEDFEYDLGPHATFEEAWAAFQSKPEPQEQIGRERSKAPKWRALPKYVRMTPSGKFQAFIYQDNRHIWSKNFKDLGEAVKARKEKAAELGLSDPEKKMPKDIPAKLPRGIRLDGSKFVVKVAANCQQYYVGRFSRLEDAVEAQTKKRREIQSECSATRGRTKRL